ncbi:MAG: energy transducer TonB [Acidobacteria bacterium]|nr:energy transducer TonB [Acidobacteriota bacterium]
MAKKEKENKALNPSADEEVGLSYLVELYSPRENRRLKIATLISLLVHIGLFFIVFPEVKETVTSKAKEKPIVSIKKFKLPPPPKRQPPKRRKTTAVVKKGKIVPIPDPTPDEPEPYREYVEYVEEYTPPPPDTEFEYGIPAETPGPLRVGGNVKKPVRIKYVPPVYPELARKARIQGIVIIEAVIDRHGNVVRAKVLRSPGKAFGFDQAAIDAVRQWKFKPATLNGKPVDVYYNLTVIFKLQGQ